MPPSKLPGKMELYVLITTSSELVEIRAQWYIDEDKYRLYFPHDEDDEHIEHIENNEDNEDNEDNGMRTDGEEDDCSVQVVPTHSSQMSRERYELGKPVKKKSGYDRITLDDPVTHKRIDGNIIAIITPNMDLLVTLPGLVPRHAAMERAYILKGKEYDADKKRFLGAGGRILVPTQASTTWAIDEVELNLVACSKDGKRVVVLFRGKDEKHWDVMTRTNFKASIKENDGDNYLNYRLAVSGLKPIPGTLKGGNPIYDKMKVKDMNPLPIRTLKLQ
jgi:hypothetical protein